jgi:protein gp37
MMLGYFFEELTMGKTTGISWCDHTFNPWWGCTKVSSGCANCYAETFSKRTTVLPLWGDDARRRFFGEKHWREPLAWDRVAAKSGVRAKVFCGSMCDVFEDRQDLYRPRVQLWNLVRSTSNLQWLLLTKRPENMDCLLPWGKDPKDSPWFNVWLGTSVENQAMADERIPHLLKCPAAVRFLSIEPMLSPVDLTQWIGKSDLVIVGGESGPKRRPFNKDWSRSIRDQCQAAGVPFFFKQGSALHPGQDDLLDGKRYKEFPK